FRRVLFRSGRGAAGAGAALGVAVGAKGGIGGGERGAGSRKRAVCRAVAVRRSESRGPSRRRSVWPRMGALRLARGFEDYDAEKVRGWSGRRVSGALGLLLAALGSSGCGASGGAPPAAPAAAGEAAGADATGVAGEAAPFARPDNIAPARWLVLGPFAQE